MRQAGAILAALLLAAQSGPALAAAYRAPRTRWGAPDLQGVWTNLSLTRLERPRGVDTSEVSAAEAPAMAKRMRDELRGDAGDTPVGQRATEWAEEGGVGVVDGRFRAAWLTEPADGRLPYNEAGRRGVAAGFGLRADGPETLTASDRCLAAGWSALGPPMLNPPYGPIYTLMQTPTEVVIFAEANHEVRTIRLDGSRPPAGARTWGGWSSGRWEGATLVVETTGFHPGESFRAPLYFMSPDAKVTERFTRTGPDLIRYEFAVDDPAAFTRPWRGELPMRRTTGRTYEVACHEGNYSLLGILGGARRAERDAAASQGRR